MGGNDGAVSLDSCERYDPHLDKWSYVAPMNQRRAGAGITELHGQLYAVGELWTKLAKFENPKRVD